jgi:hypothetical protein
MEREVSSRHSSFNHALPFELLGTIFSHISEDSLDLRSPILVCRSWHNAIVHHANLWTNIILGYTFLTRFRGARLRHGEAFVRLCISRSSPLPLRISVHDSDCRSLYRNVDGGLPDECFSLVKHILDSNTGEPEYLFQRCRSLSWVFSNTISDIDLAARVFTSASFPVLEHLTIQNLFVVHGDSRIGFPRLPRLKEVILVDHLETSTPPFFHDDDFAHAERLTFTVTSRWMDYDVNCIRRFRSIRILMLKGGGLYDHYVETLLDPLKPVELSLLETLSLYGKVSHQVLTLIKTPRLRKMEIEADRERGLHSLVASDLVHLVRSLERLYVSLCEGVHVASWVEELERLVGEAPSPIRVCVSPWMVQYLRREAWCAQLNFTDFV